MYRIKYALYHAYAFFLETILYIHVSYGKFCSCKSHKRFFPLVHLSFISDRIFKCNKCGESATVCFLDSYIEFDIRINRKHISISVMINAIINTAVPAVCPSKHETIYCPVSTF